MVFVSLQMPTSPLRLLPRWLWLVTLVALSRPLRTCVARTITDRIWRMQLSGGHVPSSAAKGPALVCRRIVLAESATECAHWYLLSLIINLRISYLLDYFFFTLEWHNFSKQTWLKFVLFTTNLCFVTLNFICKGSISHYSSQAMLVMPNNT